MASPTQTAVDQMKALGVDQNSPAFVAAVQANLKAQKAAPTTVAKTTTVTTPTTTKTQAAATTPSSSPSTSTAPSYIKADGTFDASYAPKDLTEIASAPVDNYTKQQWAANYYKANGMDFGTMPASQLDEAKIFNDNANSKQSEMEKQAAQAKADADRQLAELKSANAASTAQNREGAVSAGNYMSKDAVDLAMQTRYDANVANIQSQLKDLTYTLQNAKTGFVREQLNNQIQAVQAQLQKAQEVEQNKQKQSMDMLKLLNDSGGLANLSAGDLAYLQDGMPGAPAGIVQALSKAATTKYNDEKTKNQLTQLNTFADLASKGVQLPIDSIFSFAKSTGLPAEALYQTSQLAAQIMADKNLTMEEKKTKIADSMFDLNLKQQGVLTDAGKKTLELTNLYKNGADAATISAFKQAAGLTDYDDPITKAKLAQAQLQNSIDNKKLKGEPVGYDEMQKYLDNQRVLVDAGQAPSAVIPAGKKYTVTNNGNWVKDMVNRVLTGKEQKYDSSVSVGVKDGASAGQCGHFVNDVFGNRIVGDSYDQKMSLTDPKITVPTPGMAFVQDVNTKYGHIGIVEKVDLAKGTMSIVESNWNGTEKIGRRTIPISSASGFIRPPNGKAVTATGTPGDSSPQSTGDYNKFLNDALGKGLTMGDAKAYAKDKTLASLDPSKQGNKDFTQANQLYNRYDSTAKEIRTLDQGFAIAKNFDINTKNPYDDQSLIFSFMKVLDPGSVVREGEFKTAQNNASMLQSMAANWQNAANGTGMLLPEQRQKILESMKSLQSKKMGEYETLVNQQAEAGKKLGFDDPSVFLDYTPDYFKKNKASAPVDDASLYHSYQAQLSSADQDLWNNLPN